MSRYSAPLTFSGIFLSSKIRSQSFGSCAGPHCDAEVALAPHLDSLLAMVLARLPDAGSLRRQGGFALGGQSQMPVPTLMENHMDSMQKP